jgi:hypothetical protein
LDGADEKGKSFTHPKKRSEESFYTYVQQNELDSGYDDEESRVSDEQEEAPPSTNQGMNGKSRWNSLPFGIQKIPSFAVPPTNPFERSHAPECRGEQSRASPLQAPHYQVPPRLREVGPLLRDKLGEGRLIIMHRQDLQRMSYPGGRERITRLRQQYILLLDERLRGQTQGENRSRVFLQDLVRGEVIESMLGGRILSLGLCLRKVCYPCVAFDEK